MIIRRKRRQHQAPDTGRTEAQLLTNSFLADFVDVWPNTIRTRQYQEVLALIGQIHYVDNLPTRKIAAPGNQGMVEPGMQGVCVRNPATHEPASVEIADRASTPLFTMAHEFGHCVDYALKKTISLTNSMKASDAYASVFDAIWASTEYRWLVAEQRGSEVSLVAISSLIGKAAADQVMQKLKHIKYLLKSEELFARSYSQYVALKSDNETLLTDLDQYTSYREDDPYYQWQDQSFQPIFGKFDDLFASIGWAVR